MLTVAWWKDDIHTPLHTPPSTIAMTCIKWLYDTSFRCSARDYSFLPVYSWCSQGRSGERRLRRTITVLILSFCEIAETDTFYKIRLDTSHSLSLSLLCLSLYGYPPVMVCCIVSARPYLTCQVVTIQFYGWRCQHVILSARGRAMHMCAHFHTTVSKTLRRRQLLFTCNASLDTAYSTTVPLAAYTMFSCTYVWM